MWRTSRLTPSLRKSGSRAPHIDKALQRAQKRHHIRLVPPSNRTWSLSPCQCRQCQLFRFKVRLGIDVGRIERHMSEPSTDRIDINARLQKMAGGRVSDDVRTDPLSLKRRHRRSQLCNIALNERVNTVTRQRLAATVHENVRLGRTFTGELTEML